MVCEVDEGLTGNPPSRHRRCSSHRRKLTASSSTVHRYYDPSTAQFLSQDPLVAQTGEPHAFAGDNPDNAADPFGLRWYYVRGKWHWYTGTRYAGMCHGAETHCGGPGTEASARASAQAKSDGGLWGFVRRLATDAWRPARVVLNAPETAVAVTGSYVTGGSCKWNSSLWVAECFNSGLAKVTGRPFTMGSAVMSPISEKQTRKQETQLCVGVNGWLNHETRHSDQWATFGPIFGLYYGIDSAIQGSGSQNRFEQAAGLYNGGYLNAQC